MNHYYLGEPLALKIFRKINALNNESHRYKKDFPRVFKALGKLENVYKIRLDETPQPFSIANPRRLPLPMKQKVGNSSVYEKKRKYPPELLLPSKLPDYPWQKVGMDLFELKGHTCLMIIDYYSRWIEVSPLQKNTSDNIVSRNGIPELVMSDNGPQFTSTEFLDFSNRFSFIHLTSSTQAERAV